jgi:hypothetical protein
MQGKAKEEWMQVCEQAAVEQDSEKLMALIMEINRMLDEKEHRLNSGKPRKHSSTAEINVGGRGRST